MADNVTLPGSGEIVSADDIGGGVKVQRFKLQLGADGSATDVGLGQKTTAASMPVAWPSDFLMPLGKQSFNRPGDTTAYSANDLIANSTAAGSVAPLAFTGVTISGNGGSGLIDELIISKSGANIALIRAHFLYTSHAVTNGDNGQLIFTSMNLDNYLGWIDVVCSDLAYAGGGAMGYAANCALGYRLTSGDTLYCFLEALGAITPLNAETFTVLPKVRRFS